LGSWLRGQIEPKLVHGLIISVAPPPRPCGARSSGSQSAASGGLRLSAARPQPYPHSGAASAGPCSVIILARGTRNSYSHHSGHPAGPPLSSQPPQSAAEPAHQAASASKGNRIADSSTPESDIVPRVLGESRPQKQHPLVHLFPNEAFVRHVDENRRARDWNR
jgi:hypothetical protein